MQNRNCNTALHEAVRMRDEKWDLVPRLIQHGADVNLKTRLKTTPLHYAVLHCAPEDIITQLISPHNINMKDKYGETALLEAVKWQRWEQVPVLLQHGADVNLSDRENRTPLHIAIHRWAPADIITRLISPHNINMQGEEGNTALHEAVREKLWELVPVLLQHGADVNVRNDFNQLPLHSAAHHGAPAGISTQLISPHNINMQDKNGYTALHEAVSRKRWELVPVLLQHGADPSMLDSPQLDQPSVLSLQPLCIATIRSHMPVKSDAAYKGLGLPGKLVAEVKLRPQAEDIVERKPLLIDDNMLVRRHMRDYEDVGYYPVHFFSSDSDSSDYETVELID